MVCSAKTLPDFAIGNKAVDLDRNKLLKIDNRPKDVEQMITDRYGDVNRPHTKAETSTVDLTDVKTFEGGCRFLRLWYREKF